MLHIIPVCILALVGAGYVFRAWGISRMEYTDPVLRELSHHPVAVAQARNRRRYCFAMAFMGSEAQPYEIVR
ncbi:hypothetical protein FOT62_21305 [Serratia marcescens]|uniref:Uncharacterized protein n=1 Tax=Serratia marcescens TaxID=615 RepID=A0A5C7BW41_SERMA|nr:hypothetical protein [Serratia marcescens]TXE28310.1 hypothetical protein FOT62_21305 [Serratia marcescens]TXE56883.1 hypothetical protein FOT56_23750 [Serratia marcescens]